MTERASCWSITINNPTAQDTSVDLPSQWVLEGQYEQGKEGTQHFQGLLRTPQVRFSAVKKVFPRAHIEVARNASALKVYVHKSDTKVGEFETRKSEIPSWYEYSDELASRFDLDAYNERIRNLTDKQLLDYDVFGNVRLLMIDQMIEKDLEEGRKGIEWIGVNPNFRQAWKRYGISMVKRSQKKSQEKIYNGDVGETQQTISEAQAVEEAPDS